MVRVQTRGGAKQKSTFVKTKTNTTAKVKGKDALRTNAPVGAYSIVSAGRIGVKALETQSTKPSRPVVTSGARKAKNGKGDTIKPLTATSRKVEIDGKVKTALGGDAKTVNQRKIIKTYASKSKAKAKAIVVTRRSAKNDAIGTSKKLTNIRTVPKSAKVISKEERVRAKTTKSKSGNEDGQANEKNRTIKTTPTLSIKTKTLGITPTILSRPPTSTDTATSESALDKTGTVKVKLPKKEYMIAGFYCQDPHPAATRQLVSQILRVRSAESKTKSAKQTLVASSSISIPTRVTRARDSKSTTTTLKRNKGLTAAPSPTPVIAVRPSFPPLPYDHGYDLFFRQQHDFELPFNIRFEAENGLLVRKAKPTAFQKLRGNVYPERPRVSADSTAVCRCSPDSGCGDNCINRIMSYLCGKECPAGDKCTNKTLTKRKGPGYKVVHTGARGFGIVLIEDVSEGEFVIDYRGEVISMEMFMDRIQDEYKGTKNFYALEYDQDEVIDAGMRGNDARFINHGCAPNLEVRKYQTLGDGWEEYEVGMWALRDIKAGEELFYDYNFESFGVAAQSDELRTKCCCGAPNCVGFLGRKAGEKSAKELAAEMAAQVKAAKKGKKIKKRKTQILRGEIASRLSTAVLGLEAEAESTPSDTSGSTSNLSPELRTPSEATDLTFTLQEIEVIPVLDAPTLSTVMQQAGQPKQKRKSEAAVDVVDPPKDSRKKSRKSEPIPATHLTASSSSAPIPALLKGSPAPTKRSKEEKMKARNGAPKGWAYILPGAQEATRPPVAATRRPPRDRSSLG
ncbi:hypothetical protein IAT40_004965 [Kwoniella sp. CBS 6097]